MSEIQLKATNVADKPVRIGDLPIVKTNILENAGQMDKGVVGGYNGAFPLTAASQGGIYLLPSTGKFYVCETAYNGTQISAPNSNFVELSVWKNHDRLNNLINFSGVEINSKIQIRSIIFETGESSKEIASYTDLKSSIGGIHALFSTASTADGLFMPELQLYKTSSGINGILHLGEKTYTSKGNAAFYVMIFYEEII